MHPKISLKAISRDNVRECMRLQVADSQKAWVATNTQSLAQAYAEPRLIPLAIYDGEVIGRDPAPDDRMVGFVMYQVWDEVGFIMRLMIGEGYQRKGYGRATMDEVVRRLRMTPQIRVIATSVIRENEGALQLYLGMGFVDTKYPQDVPDNNEGNERYLMLEWPE